ncbi:isomerase [Candidatus Binatia bacterium]|jgi:hypothetical protein|nr:isomerase [Candidatus Binatia bacterium]
MRRHQGLLVGNGMLAICFGLIAGYGFLFNLIGEIALWPVPGAIAVQLPGDAARWRGAHVGAITNGLMAIAVALALPLAPLSAKARRAVTWAILVAVWGNITFYVANALGAANHGLTFGDNRLGAADLLSRVGFFGAYAGALVAPVALLVIARAAFAAARAEPAE